MAPQYFQIKTLYLLKVVGQKAFPFPKVLSLSAAQNQEALRILERTGPYFGLKVHFPVS